MVLVVVWLGEEGLSGMVMMVVVVLVWLGEEGLSGMVLVMV